MTLHPQLEALFLDARKRNARRLRIAIVTGEQVPNWARTLAKFLGEIPDFEAGMVSVAAHPELEMPSLTERLYRLSQARFDPFGSTTAQAGNFRAADFDVAVWLADAEPADFSRCGIFTVRFGDGDAIPFWSEIECGNPVSAVTIFWHDFSLTQGRAMARIETATRMGLFVTENAEEPLVAAMRTLGELCLEIQADQFRERAMRHSAEATGRRGEYPSNWRASPFAASKLARSARLRWKARGKRLQWFVAIRPDQGRGFEDVTGFREIAMPRGVSQMADPFLREAEGKQYLLFEEFTEERARCRIGAIELTANGPVGETRMVLERPYHLSYPCVVEWKGDLFMIPESSEAARVDLFRFRRFPEDVEIVSTPVEKAALVDTTPIEVDGRWYFFTTAFEPYQEAMLFSSDRLDGRWELHPASPISRTVRNCRPAGKMFWKKGRLYRPAQDCSVCYGYAIVINEVTKLTPSEFEERRAGYVAPTWAAGLEATHTWNENAAFQVIDGLRYIA